jgi:hypothetical protein
MTSTEIHGRPNKKSWWQNKIGSQKSARAGQETKTLLVQELHKAKKMTPDPAVQAKEKEKQGPDLLQHKQETNLSEKSDQHRGTACI